MRDGWIETTLGDVADVIDPHPSHRAPAIDDAGIPFIGIGDLRRSGDINFAKARMVSREILEEHKARYSRSDFLIGLGRVASIGMVVRLPDERVDYAVSPTLAVIRARTVLGSFLFYLLQGNYCQEQFQKFKKGSTRESVGMQILRKIKVHVPPLNEQERIVDLISTVDSYIEALRQQLETAKISRNAVLHELLTAGGDEWVETTLGEVAEWWSGGTPKAREPKYYDNGSIPWAVIADMHKGVIDSTNTSITKDALEVIGGRLAPVGSVLISMYASVGKSAIARVPLATNQAIAWSIPNESKIVPLFLFLVSQRLEKEIADSARGATQRNINRKMLREFVFQLPPLHEQKRIVDLISTVDSYIEALEGQISSSTSLRSGLLSDLLGGDHEIPASYDHLIGAA